MVVGIPLAKIVPLAFKIVTKPMVDGLKRSVTKSPFWKDRVFLPLARNYNKTSVRMRLWTQGITRNKEQVERSAHLSDEAALELGAEIMANSLTFVIGVVAIGMQQYMSNQAEKKKELKEMQEAEQLEMTVIDLRKKTLDLGLSVERLDAQIREMNRTMMSMKAYNQASKPIYSEKPSTVTLTINDKKS